MSGTILCGTTISFENGALAKLLSVSGLGANRKVIDMTDADSPDLWGEFIGSCIAKLKAFRVQLKFLTNVDWSPLLQAAASALLITWPVEEGFTTAGTMGFKAFVADVSIDGELESRMTSTYEIQPTGKPTITPGSD